MNPLDQLIEEALWRLCEEDALAIVRFQRATGVSGADYAKALVVLAPSERQRDILHALVEADRAMRTKDEEQDKCQL